MFTDVFTHTRFQAALGSDNQYGPHKILTQYKPVTENTTVTERYVTAEYCTNIHLTGLRNLRRQGMYV
jgi:hypothetical protein